MRGLSIDGQVHRRCGDGQCGLFLLAWQDWCTESGVGFAYFDRTPPPGKSVVTASGDLGTIARELGDGWWWVE
jgi:hypothetical protein